MAKKLSLLLGLTILSMTFAFSQEISQTVRGKIVDKESKFPLIGVAVKIEVGDQSFGGTTDFDGKYKIENVPIGRHTVVTKYVGYNPNSVPVIVNSGKELILNVELEEAAFEMKEVEVKADEENEGVRNDMALVSVKSFSVEETEKYAGSRSDPARMASNFAGVQGADDSRNDIVVRGNSPLGILYRVEGIDIPNPNHFSIPGSTGGGQSILNNKFMANSDFFTGAFPAEYGNSIAGVFDLRLRNGNNEKHEFSGQFGILGVELMGEGPISREKGSSYLAAYRYSTLSLFDIIGIPIGTNAVPKYQDLSFRLNFPQSKGGSISVWGMSGISNIDIVLSDDKEPEIDLFGQQDRDQYFGSAMAVGGVTYLKPINEKTFFKTTVAGSIEQQGADHNFFLRHVDSTDNYYVLDTLFDLMDYKYTQSKVSWAMYVNKKLSKKSVLKYGFNSDFYIYNFTDSIQYFDSAGNATNTWNKRWDHQGSAFLIQPYIQLKHKFTERLALNFGLHSQYFSLNNSFSAIEPRLGLKWNINESNVLSAGAGLHSQIQPVYTYFFQKDFNGDGNYTKHNIDMGFSKSVHLVTGYSSRIGKGLNLKSEVYYQYLFNIPVESSKESSYSAVNQGSGFGRLFPDSLANNGTGYNYGLELTLQKTFAAGAFVMFTGAIYTSKYRGSDNVLRNTSYNGNYATNLLFGKEFKIGDNKTFNIGGKVTWAGGKRIGIVDVAASQLAKEVVFRDSAFNDIQFRDYFRADLKTNFKINAKKVTHEIGIDLVNFLGIKNVLNLTYAPTPDDPTRIVENYQLGFLPIFYYRIDF